MFESLLRQFRVRLSSPDALLAYALLGAAAGLVTGLVIIVFRFALIWPESQYLPGGDPENFEDLPRWLHFTLPIFGGLLLGLLFMAFKPEHRGTGVTHVIATLNQGSSRMPIANAVLQFFASVLVFATGQSAGREGPAVHLGAAASNALGNQFRLPNNSLRVLAACGSAAAIAASFNTPIAGVIFAMEVIMLEYTISGFVPVIVAAVIATAITQAAFGNEALLVAPDVVMNSLWDLPFVFAMGIAIGLLSAGFVVIQKLCLRLHDTPVMLRMLMAGLVTGLCAYATPQIMGAGYDSFGEALHNTMAIQILVALVITKTLATAVSCGMGMPAGIIGPSLLIGAFAGGVMAAIGHHFSPELASEPGFYVMMGMGAMMGALMNAPLAALLALLELTQNTALVFPAMLVIVVALLTHRELCKQPSSPQATLSAVRKAMRTDPITQILMRTSALAVMDRAVNFAGQYLDLASAQKMVKGEQRWLLVEQTNEALPRQRLFANREWRDALSLELEKRSAKQPETQPNTANTEGGDAADTIDLLALLPEGKSTPVVEIQATLREVLETMRQAQTDRVLVGGFAPDSPIADVGALSRDDIEKHYGMPLI